MIERRRSAPRVVISNVFPDDNRGGAAITAATIETVRKAWPGARVSLVTTGAPRPEAYRHTLARHPSVELLPPLVPVPRGPLGGVRAVLRSLLAMALPALAAGSTLERIREAAAVVGKGGEVFTGKRRGGALAGFWLAVFPLVLGRRLRLPTALHAITVGPYRPGSAAARLAGWVLRRVDLVLVRDRRSYREARMLGVPSERLQLVPDVVFSMEAPDVEWSSRTAERLELEPLRFGAVTITTSRGAHDDELFDFLGASLKQVLGQGVVDTIAVVLQTHGRASSDGVASEAFVRRFDDPRVRLIEDDLSPEDLIALYGAAAFMVGCRLHSTLFSVIAGTPAFPISRATTVKADDLFETLGLERFVVRLEGDEEAKVRLAVRLAEDLEQASAEREALQREILAAAQRLRDGQAIAVDRLRALREAR